MNTSNNTRQTTGVSQVQILKGTGQYQEVIQAYAPSRIEYAQAATRPTREVLSSRPVAQLKSVHLAQSTFFNSYYMVIPCLVAMAWSVLTLAG